MKHIIIIVIGLFLSSSCSIERDNCAAMDPREPAINIRIQNEAGNSLIGENKIYKPSQITLTRNDQTIPLIFDDETGQTYIKLYYPEMESGKDYKLKLNNQETDTLKLKLRYLVGQCFGFLYVNTFYINYQKIEMDSLSNSYIIKK